MALAVIAGLIVGLVALIPLYFAANNVRKIISADGGALSMLGPFLLTIAISFIVLIVRLIAGKLLAPDVVLPMAGAEFAAFIIGVIAFGIWLSKRK